MSSVLTNTSAISAVANLSATQKSLSDTQNQISTGLKVSSAKDNAAYFSIATTMRTSVSNLSAVTDSLNLGSSVIGTATSALTTITSVLTKMQADLTSAAQAGTDKASIGTDLAALQSQLQSSVSSASFNGVNLLDGSSATAQFVSSISGSGATSKVNYLSIDQTKTDFGTGTGSLFSVTQTANQAQGVTAGTVNIVNTNVPDSTTGVQASDANMIKVDANTTNATLQNYIAAVGAALNSASQASEILGSAQKNIDLQSTFISSLSSAITTGVGSLVDADMNAASTRLSALQTQQQLGIQALSVANQNSQLILKLFQ